MKFGKHLQKRQLDIPEYASSFVNYKGLKKLIKQLAVGTRPSIPRDGPISRQNSDNLNALQAALQANKATFFFKLDREIEKVNAFYLQKQEELKLRLGTLLDKKKLMQSRSETASKTSTTFVTLLEGFQLFGNDLSKLQQFIELNQTGFSKILKKWDKTSKSRTKELYLSRAVDVQPCFNRDVISELSDQATTSLMELEAWAEGENVTFSRDNIHSAHAMTTVHDADADFLNTVMAGNVAILSDAINAIRSNTRAPQRVTRAFLSAIPDASDQCLSVLLNSGLVEFRTQDEINERNCLHEAAIAGKLSILQAALVNGVDFTRADVYGRLPIHYACMHGQVAILEELLQSKSQVINAVDHDNLSPLVHSINHRQTECVRRLIDHQARIDPSSDQDFIPLNLACQNGFTEIAEMLLIRGAKILADAEGLFPQHLIARKGHSSELLLMLQKYGADFNEFDKLNQWTPIFHAASEGNLHCLQTLLDNGARQDVLDEEGLSALYYAAWEGHLKCMHVLYIAGTRVGLQSKALLKPQLPTPQSAESFTHMNIDSDGIPDLYLPPPILPLRRYGHNYLDKKTFIQLTFTGKGSEAVHFYQAGKYPAARLTISSKSSDIIPRNIQLPLTEDSKIVSFQIDSLDSFGIDFDIFPTFGTKVVAKTAALPRLFNVKTLYNQCVLPLFDSRTRAIGQVSFDFQIIKPFQGIPLEIAHFATYWKATSQLDSRPLITGSSLSGSYVRVIVQVTRDFVPVVYPSYSVKFSGLHVPICNLTYAEFQMIGLQHGYSSLEISRKTLNSASSLEQLYTLIHSSFLNLSEILNAIPTTVHLNLHVLYPDMEEQKTYLLPAVNELNSYIDCILNLVFEHARSVREQSPESIRSIMFSADNKSACTALNWKQPNYPVFFSNSENHTDDAMRENRSTASDFMDREKSNSSSLKEAVRFAKNNNLMGLICSAQLLEIVPALIQSVKVEGLVLVAGNSAPLTPIGEEKAVSPELDGVLVNEGILRFSETIDM